MRAAYELYVDERQRSLDREPRKWKIPCGRSSPREGVHRGVWLHPELRRGPSHARGPRRARAHDHLLGRAGRRPRPRDVHRHRNDGTQDGSTDVGACGPRQTVRRRGLHGRGPAWACRWLPPRWRASVRSALRLYDHRGSQDDYELLVKHLAGFLRFADNSIQRAKSSRPSRVVK